MPRPRPNPRTAPHAAVLLIVVAAIAAGCMGDAGVAKQRDTTNGVAGTPTPTSSPGASPTGPGTGSLRGTVTDDEARPLAEATVTLVALDREARTDDAGSFAFDEVPPGTHDLSVDHPQHRSAGRTVEVQAGQAAQVVVLLERLPFEGGYRETLVLDVYVPVGNALFDIVFCNEIGGNCVFTLAASPNLVAMVEEFEFTPTLPHPTGARMYFQLRDTDAGGNLYRDGVFGSGAKYVIEGDWDRDGEPRFWQFTGCELQYVCVDQRITAWVTFFYVDPPADDFTALEA